MRILLALALALLIGTFDGYAQDKSDRDIYGGVTSLKGNSTGWFHVEQIRGRWFFVTPEGNAFFSLAVTHTGETINQDEIGIFKSNFDGSQERMGEFFLERMKDWGFNSAGYGPLAMMESRIPYVATIWTEGPRSKSAGAKSQNSDIFDPKVQSRLREKVRQAAKRHITNRYCLGYVFIDLPIWTTQPQPGPSYVEFLQALPENAPGRVALAKYTSDRADVDDETLMNYIAETYYNVVCSELRKSDPNHLILGDRFMAAMGNKAMHTPDSVLRTASRFVDVVSFQPMGTQKPIQSFIDHVSALTGKPVLLADVNTMTMRPEKQMRDSTRYETEAGEHTLEYYMDAASSDACIGLHRCTMRDYYPWNPQFHRRGLLKADDIPYSILIDFTRRTNEQVIRKVYRLNP
jgi:hypothetical protein